MPSGTEYRAFILGIRGSSLSVVDLGEGQLHVWSTVFSKGSICTTSESKAKGGVPGGDHDLPSAIAASEEPLPTLPESGQAHTQIHCPVEEFHKTKREGPGKAVCLTGRHTKCSQVGWRASLAQALKHVKDLQVHLDSFHPLHWVDPSSG